MTFLFFAVAWTVLLLPPVARRGRRLADIDGGERQLRPLDELAVVAALKGGHRIGVALPGAHIFVDHAAFAKTVRQ